MNQIKRNRRKRYENRNKENRMDITKMWKKIINKSNITKLKRMKMNDDYDHG